MQTLGLLGKAHASYHEMGLTVFLLCAVKTKPQRKGNSTHPEHHNLAQLLTKEFLEGKMNEYTQKVGGLHQRALTHCIA